MENDPLLLSRSLEAQFRVLITEPLQKLAKEDHGHYLQSQPTFVIVDGLDECTDSKAQQKILDIIVTAAQQQDTPLFFLIASRPEHHIREAFNRVTLSNFSSTRIVLDSTYLADLDIERFLTDKFAVLRQTHPSKAHLPFYWPSNRQIRSLIRKSSGQFIYASTVMKYVESSHHHPEDRLNEVFGLLKASDDNPFAELDAVYRHCLSSTSSIPKVKEILSYLIHRPFKEVPSMRSFTADVLDTFFFYRPGQAAIILSELSSVVEIDRSPRSEQLYRISHASLSDFLMDRVRAGPLFIDRAESYTRFALLCTGHLQTSTWLKTMRAYLT